MGNGLRAFGHTAVTRIQGKQPGIGFAHRAQQQPAGGDEGPDRNSGRRTKIKRHGFPPSKRMGGACTAPP